jgi:hypothetical protein
MSTAAAPSLTPGAFQGRFQFGQRYFARISARRLVLFNDRGTAATCNLHKCDLSRQQA